MRKSSLAALAYAVFMVVTLAACGGARGGCAAHVPVGPIPAGTPIPVQPLPPNSGLSTTATVGIDFTINASGAVSSERVRLSSGSAVVDNAALQIVDATLFKAFDTNCDGVPVTSGFVDVMFSPNG